MVRCAQDQNADTLQHRCGTSHGTKGCPDPPARLCRNRPAAGCWGQASPAGWSDVLGAGLPRLPALRAGGPCHDHAHAFSCVCCVHASVCMLSTTRTWIVCRLCFCAWSAFSTGPHRPAHPRCRCCSRCWTGRAWLQHGWWRPCALLVGWVHAPSRVTSVPVCTACCCCAAANACQLKLDAPVMPEDGPGCCAMLLTGHTRLHCIMVDQSARGGLGGVCILQ